jgi:glutamate dehydrogenase
VTVHGEGGVVDDVDLAALEAEVASLARTWDDKLADRLVGRLGQTEGERLARRWAPLLPDYYKSSVDPRLAVLDIQQLERIRAGEPFAVALQNERSSNRSLTRIELYKAGEKVALTDFLPILEDLGLRVIEEVPTRIATGEGEDILIHDFGVLDATGGMLDLDAMGTRIVDLITAARSGIVESDSLNRLVIDAGLDWRQVEVVRAYWRYRQRVGTQFTPALAFNAFVAHPDLTARLVRYFELRFSPEEADDEGADALRTEILAALDEVSSLDEDRVLRSLLSSIDATVRTNAYLPGRAHLSLKIRSSAVPEMPKPTPFMEIYVYSTEMEGIHLRGGPVARGGLRWSDRQEDYRTEVLGLMKAQMVKNAVIVPVGSKGGFVLKRAVATREELREEVVRQYRTFIRGLLDVTDDRAADGTIVHPEHVRVLDGDDPYLVVAADKGTATFSDTANGIAREYGFWLDDAFASGGSAGYDHKALGITARGAWESVRRHFRELGVDVASDPFTVIGVGDMSGDVFGNGMLLSPAIRLVAAFDHRHLFLDPDPDPETSFAERRRLFELPGSSWDDYDRTLISPGGGVFARSDKSIALTDEVRAALGTEAATATPAELLSTILRAPVDLFWNGGVGTFVRASDETQAEAGDRTNDAIRIAASELRVRVVAEGGNLGFTQRARIEYATAGGRINTDAIDNSAGVDTSDHEVNLKILVGIAEQRGDLTRKQRDVLLASVADDVCRHVLYTNYQQNQILSQELALAPARVEPAEDLMEALAARGLLERSVEYLPSTEEMAERRRQGRGLTRPELAVLLAYAKRSLDDDVVSSPLPDDPYLDAELERYFPDPVVERFRELLPEHPLRRELISTIVANDVVNSQGITFVSRMASETGAQPAEVARAFWIARAVTGATEKWDALEALDGQLDPDLQRTLMSQVDELVEATSRWYLQRLPNAPLGETIAEHRARFAEFEAALPTSGSAPWRERHEAAAAALADQGVPGPIARRHATLDSLEHGPDAIQVAAATGRPIADVAEAFFLVGEPLHLEALETRLARLARTTRWQRWAAQAASDDLLRVRRLGAEQVLATGEGRPVAESIEDFVAAHREASDRLRRLIDLAEADSSDDLAVLAVAIRGVRNVVA